MMLVTYSPCLLNPAEEIGRALRESGSAAWYLLDACQSIGQMPIDVDAIGAGVFGRVGDGFASCRN